MFNRIELIAGTLFAASLVAAILLVQSRFSATTSNDDELPQAQAAGIIFVQEQDILNGEFAAQESSAKNVRKLFDSVIVDDIQIGTGETVEFGDTVLVHYSGTLQEGLKFESSRKRGEPFEFQVGTDTVITGWNEGILGMKKGGERVLVIPPNKAYGEQSNGPIPAGATLVFTIELLEVT